MTGPEFRAALKSLHLSQRSLAGRLGVEPSTVNRWAVGKAAVPQYVAYVLELLAEQHAIAHLLLALRRSQRAFTGFRSGHALARGKGAQKE